MNIFVRLTKRKDMLLYNGAWAEIGKTNEIAYIGDEFW